MAKIKDLPGGLKDLAIVLAMQNVIAEYEADELREGDVVEFLRRIEDVDLVGAFPWSFTQEGHLYWRDIDEKYSQK